MNQNSVRRPGDDYFQRYTQSSPLKCRRTPGLAVLDAEGKLVYSQKNGEFENARARAPEDFLAFLNKWKPGAQS